MASVLQRELGPDDVAWAKRAVRSIAAARQMGDDAEGVALLGLWYAALRYDESLDLAWDRFAYAVIRNTVWDEARRMDYLRRPHRHQVKAGDAVDVGPPLSLTPPTGHDGREAEPSWEGSCDPLADVPLALTVDEALRKMDDRRGAVLRLHVEQDWTLDEIGELLWLGRSRVSQLLSEARVQLRWLLGLSCEDLLSE